MLLKIITIINLIFIVTAFILIGLLYVQYLKDEQRYNIPFDTNKNRTENIIRIKYDDSGNMEGFQRWYSSSFSYINGWYDIDLKEYLGIDKLKKQMNCNHEYHYDSYILRNITYTDQYEDIYIFKCTKCGSTIEKTYQELTDSEVEALTNLGVINE